MKSVGRKILDIEDVAALPLGIFLEYAKQDIVDRCK